MRQLRIAVRTLLSSPAFTVTAVLTLGLAFGTAAAAIALLDVHLLRPLPYRDAARLVAITETNASTGDDRYPVAPANAEDIRRSSRLEESGALVSRPFQTTLREGDPELVNALLIEPRVLRMLGVEPALGRLFADEEATAGRDAVVLVSDDLFRRRFGGDASLVGRSIRHTETVTVVGVLPRGFRTPAGAADLYFPLSYGGRFFDANRIDNRSVHYLTLLGRLAPGTSVASLGSELGGLARELAKRYPDSNSGIGLGAVPLREFVVGDARRPLLVLAAAVLGLLAIAVANVGGLFVARAASREKERVVRQALGASRLQLLVPTFAEGAVVAGLGAALGLALGSLAVKLVAGLEAIDLPLRGELRLGAPEVAAVVTLAALVALAFGLAPLARAKDPSPRSRGVLSVAQIALSFVLLAGASLLVRSFVRMLDRDPGFVPRGVLTLQTILPGGRYDDPAARIAFHELVASRLAALPGVTAVGATTRLPLGPVGNVSSALVREGVTEGAPAEVDYRVASDGYFRAMGIAVKEGRTFSPGDATPVVMVNATAARQLWPAASPLGKRVRLGPNPASPWRTVVGVVGDVRHHGLSEDARPEVYLPLRQSPPGSPFVVVRTSGEPLAAASAVRGALRALDPELVVANVAPMESVVARSVARRRLGLALASGLAAVALALAAVGLYGLLSTSVLRRTREIGVRVAVGAGSPDILRLVLAEGLTLTAAGLLLGLGGALATTRLMSSLLVDVTPADPAALGTAALVLLSTAFVACSLPAGRAARLDPLTALRHDA